jgi:hypothetical protein
VLHHVAFCPNPPLLVPAVASGAAPELDALRSECLVAVRDLIDSGVDLIIVIGAGSHTRLWDAHAGGTMRGYGPDVAFGGPHLVLPLSLTIGAYLLDTVNAAVHRSYQAIAKGAPPEAAAQVGAELADLPAFLRAGGPSRGVLRPISTQKRREDQRAGLLVMGDGSAKRTTTAPGYFDERAERYDDAIAAALASIDVGPLLALDPGLADELWVDGRVGWQAAAGAIAAVGGHDKGASWNATLRYHEAPYGVGYLVANWSRADPSQSTSPADY